MNVRRYERFFNREFGTGAFDFIHLLSMDDFIYNLLEEHYYNKRVDDFDIFSFEQTKNIKRMIIIRNIIENKDMILLRLL